MYQQFNEQFAVATRQFADTAAQINRLALENAQAVFGLQLSALQDRAGATFSYLNEVAQVRDLDGVRNVWPKGVQVARENFERAVSVGQEVLGRTAKTQEAMGQITRSQLETNARRAGQAAEDAQAEFVANANKAANAGAGHKQPGNK